MIILSNSFKGVQYGVVIEGNDFATLYLVLLSVTIERITLEVSPCAVDAVVSWR
jgi:hypothetical protein